MDRHLSVVRLPDSSRFIRYQSVACPSEIVQVYTCLDTQPTQMFCEPIRRVVGAALRRLRVARNAGRPKSAGSCF